VAGFVVVEDHVEGVVDRGGIALEADAGGDGFGQAKEGQRLVDEVWSEVEEQAVGLAGGFLPGTLPCYRAEAVEVGADVDDAAEGIGGDQLAEGLEVAVEAAVVEGGEDFALLRGEGDELAGLGAGAGHGLVDDDVFPGAEGAGGQIEVGLVGGGDDDEVDRSVVKGGVERTEDFGGGVDPRGGGSVPLGRVWGSEGYGSELQARNRGDEGAMEDSAGEAVSEDSGANWGLTHRTIVR
jgi:hypothetical protein